MKLDAEQQSELAKLARMKETYDAQIGLLELDLKRQKDALKDPIRAKVQELRNLGVPVRQIHQKGLGMEQVNSMLLFLEDRSEGLQGRLDRLTQRTGTASVGAETVVRERYPLKLSPTGRNMEWSMVDRDGDEWLFVVLDLGGQYVLEEDSDALTISDSADELRETLRAKFPGLVDLQHNPI